jgi:hypothetical protein
MEARWNFTVCSLIARSVSDFAIGQAVRDERQHIMLAHRQRFDQRFRLPSGGKGNDSFRELGAINKFKMRIRREPSSQRVELV